MRKGFWYKCDYCGCYIAYEDFNKKEAIREMILPESELSVETYETYHIECKNKEIEKTIEHQQKLK